MLQNQDESQGSPRQDLLSVADISQLYLPHAELAYLSACSTADNSTQLLADEVIHLVSGFQVAGFAHVVGSMWPAADEVCADAAKSFYEHLCAESGWQVSADDAIARHLHSATMQVREERRDEPLMWAQYVHFGA